MRKKRRHPLKRRRQPNPDWMTKPWPTIWTALDVLWAVRLLPERERQVVSLHHLARCSHKDTARMMGIGTSEVERLLAKALGRLFWKLIDHCPHHGDP